MAIEQLNASCSGRKSIDEYVALKERLSHCIDRVMALDHASGHGLCAELREKVAEDIFNLVVVGQFKRGKTCLINALMGENILPVAVVPLTSIVTILTYGDTLSVRVLFNDERAVEIDPESLSEYVTELGNPKNVKGVKEVFVTYPSGYLKNGVRLIDTPGVGSVYLHNTDVAYQYLPKSDAALFILSVDQPVSRAEIDFLGDVQQYSDRIFFLLNKIDYLSEAEIDDSVAFTKATIEEAVGSEVKIFPISAKLALNGKLSDSEDTLRISNLPAFTAVLEAFLLHEKGKVLLHSVANNLLRTLSQVRLEIDLELKSLATPIEELTEKIGAFEKRKEEILHEKRNFDSLLDGEVSRLIRDRLDRDLDAFKRDVLSKIDKGFDEFYVHNRELSLKELNDALEGYVVSEVESAFKGWHAAEEERIAEDFERICAGFIEKINDLVDELLRFSSQLFSIDYEPMQAEVLWKTGSSLYFKLKDEPVGLDMLTASITQVLPNYIGDRFKRLKSFVFQIANQLIFNRRKRHMSEAIERQAGRIRYDFLERVNKSKLGFRRQMLERIDATAIGIGSAIEQGMEQQMKGEREADQRRETLRMRVEELSAVREDLEGVKACADSM